MCVCMCVPERSGSYWEHLHVREAVTHIAATTHQPPPDPLKKNGKPPVYFIY